MIKTHRILACVALALTAPSFAQEHGVEDSGQDADQARKKLAHLYTSNCASCHLPPDPAFAVDRAWINQLADTA